MEILTPQQVRDYWPELRDFLARAVRYTRGELTVDDIPGMVEQMRFGVAVWRTEGEIDLAVVFEVKIYPRRRVINIAFAGGTELKRFIEDEPELRALCELMQADAVECYVRPSMARLLKRLSPTVEQAYTVLEWQV